ncbi:hypothetical protein F5141DRAFT_1180375, partial [Pisolithus sp. B1]
MYQADCRVSGLSQLGRAIYEEFQTIVILREQMQVMDNIYLNLLNHPQMGCVQEVSLHHGMRYANIGTRRPCASMHASREGQSCCVPCTTQSTVRLCQSRNATPLYCVRVEAWELQSRHRKGDLPNTVELSVGMRVIVTQNVETDLDITDGMRGLIVDIVLHLEEPPLSLTHDIVR